MPTPFSIFFSMVLQHATEDLDNEACVYIRYHTDGSLFNLSCPQAHTKISEQLIWELLFADAAALVTHLESALQCITSCFAEAAELFRLEVSLKKSEVLHQPGPQEEYRPPCISIGETELTTVQQFTYLGCTISSDAKLDKEIDNCSHHPAVQLRIVGHLHTISPATPWAILSALPSHHPQHPLERLCPQHRSPWPGGHQQHQSHAPQVTTMLGWTCSQDGGWQPVEDGALWRADHWLPHQRGTKEKVQGLAE